MIKKLTAIFLIIIVLFSCVRLEVYAADTDFEFDPDYGYLKFVDPQEQDNFLDWVYEYSKQNNIVAIGQRMMSDLQTGLNIVPNMAKDTVNKILNNVQFNKDSAIKNIKDTLVQVGTDTLSKLLGMYRQHGDTNISISNNLALELKLDLFSKNILNTYNINLDLTQILLEIEKESQGNPEIQYQIDYQTTGYFPMRYLKMTANDFNNYITVSMPYISTDWSVNLISGAITTLKNNTKSMYASLAPYGYKYLYFIEMEVEENVEGNVMRYAVMMTNEELNILSIYNGSHVTNKYYYLGITTISNTLPKTTKYSRVNKMDLREVTADQTDKKIRVFVLTDWVATTNAIYGKKQYAKTCVTRIEIIPDEEKQVINNINNYYNNINNNPQDYFNETTINNYYTNTNNTETYLPAAGDTYNYDYTTNNDYSQIINDYIYNYGSNVTNNYYITNITQLPEPAPIPTPQPTPTPSPSDPDEPFDPSAHTIDFSPLYELGIDLTTKFPFSIPFDIVNMVKRIFGGTRDKPPVYTVTFPSEIFPANEDQSIVIDFGQTDIINLPYFISAGRTLFFLMFVVIFIKNIKKLL